MKTNIFSKIALLFVLPFFMGSCNDNFLNIDPVDRYSDPTVWSDESLIDAFVSNIYLGQMWGMHTVMLSSLCDEAMEVWSWESQPVVQSALSPSYQGILAPNFWIMAFHNINWNNLYKNIRNCNNFFQKMEEVGFTNATLEQRKGEVHYLRAYYYFWLLRQWGGVPVIDKVYTPDDDMLVARNTGSPEKTCV